MASKRHLPVASAVLEECESRDSDLESLVESRSMESSDSDSPGSLSSDSESERSDDSEPEVSAVRTWCSIDLDGDQAAPPRFPFTGTPGMKIEAGCNNPLAFQKLFLTDEVIEKIEDDKRVRWTTTRCSPPEVCKKQNLFLGLVILQGVVGKPMQKWYWSKNKMIATPFFGKVIPEYRFSLIMKYLHFANSKKFDETTHPAPKLKKIWEVSQMILQNFQQTYVPERDISIDESLMAYKGRLSWVQYIASKRA
uniref:PiggyBac transposable element-derived protein 4-like n=1 Tax=Pyxicephalus adspersus TaxID=30357 RepID=A0A499QU62_PYXAD|nr:piggyBac transposable element-derived protein 4-like [Pyxicephalus adspersus]